MGKYGIELLDAADAPALDEAGPTEGRAARRDKLVFRFAVVIAALPFRSDGPGHDLHGRLASIIGILVISRRRGGTPLVVCSLLGCLLLARTMGPEVLGDSWNLTLTVFPFALLAFVTWSLWAGELWALPVGVLPPRLGHGGDRGVLGDANRGGGAGLPAEIHLGPSHGGGGGRGLGAVAGSGALPRGPPGAGRGGPRRRGRRGRRADGERRQRRHAAP